MAKNGNGKGVGIPFPPESLAEYHATLTGYLEALKPTNGRPVTKRALRDALRWIACIESGEIWQKRPWTSVMVLVAVPETNTQQREQGHAKVMRGDVWSAKRGVDVATGKAICDVVKYILEMLPVDRPNRRGTVIEELAGALQDEIAACHEAGATLVPLPGWINPYRPFMVYADPA